MPKLDSEVFKTARPSRDEIVHLVGDADDSVVTAILATGASYAEIEEAVEWAAGDAELLAKAGHTLEPAAQAVYDILTDEPGLLPTEDGR
jgi:hypothetical protein